MHMIDFEYNGARLSDYNLRICDFSGLDSTREIGNNITIHHVKAPDAPKYMMTGSEYDDVFSITFQTCKLSCDNSTKDYLSDVEINHIMRWLNRRCYFKFKPIYNDDSFVNVYYNGTFNVKLIKLGEYVIGLELTLNTNASYGFLEPQTHTCKLGTVGTTFTLMDSSDEIGYLYCDATIKCLGAGDLEIKNVLDPRNTVSIKQCQMNEVITMNGDTKTITSSFLHPTLPNDFNYNFFRIINTEKDNKNVISSNIPCEITFTYSPIRKVGLVL